MGIISPALQPKVVICTRMKAVIDYTSANDMGPFQPIGALRGAYFIRLIATGIFALYVVLGRSELYIAQGAYLNKLFCRHSHTPQHMKLLEL